MEKNNNRNRTMDFSKLGKVVVILTVVGCVVAQRDAKGTIVNNVGCKAFSLYGDCEECSQRYYMDDERICQPVNPNCRTYDPENGDCTGCYPGFQQIETTCLPSVIFKAFDPNCN